jgi:hypothetical protein
MPPDLVAEAAARRPILVTGVPRSGTTWVGRALYAGGEIGYLNEPFNLATSPGTIRVPVAHWYPYITVENERAVLEPLADVLAFRYPLARELRRCRRRVDLRHTIKMWRSFQYGRSRRPLVKEPHAVFSAEWFATRLGSEVVITVRHPAAVVSSWKRLGWDFDFRHLLDQPALMGDLLDPFRSEMEAALTPPGALIDRVALLWRVVYECVGRFEERSRGFSVVRHEDLSRDPVGGYRRLYDALDLTLSPAAETAIRAASSSDNPTETRVENPHETRLDSRANLENWKRRLTAEERARIRRVTEETASHYYPDEKWD